MIATEQFWRGFADGILWFVIFECVALGMFEWGRSIERKKRGK